MLRSVWAEGDILTGGAGSDTIEGRGADDIIDGDHALSVAISVRTNPADPASELGRTDLMENQATSGDFGPGTAGMTLQQAVFSTAVPRLVEPGQLVAVRQIDIPATSATPDKGLTGDCPAATVDPAVLGVVPGGATPVSVVGTTIKVTGTTNCDTAAYLAEPLAGPAFDPASQYTITFNANGSITVADNASVAAGPPFPKGDGANDTLWNVENLRFCIANDAVTKECNAFKDFSVAPTAVATPTPLAFGGVKVGTTSTLPITLTNVGLRPLTLSSVGLATGSDPSFQIVTTGTTCKATPPATVLQTAGSCIVNVKFAPTAHAAVGATVAILSNGRPLNVPVTGTGTSPIASVSPASLAFGKQNINTTSAAQTVTLSNTGDATLAIAGVGFTAGAGFSRPAGAAGGTCTTSLAAGATCTIAVRFNPTTLGVRNATLTITDDSNSVAGSTQTVSLSGEGVVPTPVAGVSPASLAFGKQNRGTTSAAQTVTLSNTGTGPLAIASVGFTPGFARQAGSCGTTLAAGANCTITVRFTPTTVGVINGTLTITDNSNNVAGSTQTVALSGEGVVPVASVSTTSLAFGNVQVNSSSSLDVALSNTGGATLAIASGTVTGAGFSRTALAVASGGCGTTLAAGASCIIRVRFLPTVGGAATGNLVITDNSNLVAGTTQTVTLSGTGTIVANPDTPANAAAPTGVNPANITFSVRANDGPPNVGTVTIVNSTAAFLNPGAGGTAVASVNGANQVVWTLSTGATTNALRAAARRGTYTVTYLLTSGTATSTATYTFTLI